MAILSYWRIPHIITCPGFPLLIGFLKTMGHGPAVLSEVVQDALENPDHGDHDTAQDQLVIDHQDRAG